MKFHQLIQDRRVPGEREQPRPGDLPSGSETSRILRMNDLVSVSPFYDLQAHLNYIFDDHFPNFPTEFAFYYNSEIVETGDHSRVQSSPEIFPGDRGVLGLACIIDTWTPFRRDHTAFERNVRSLIFFSRPNEQRTASVLQPDHCVFEIGFELERHCPHFLKYICPRRSVHSQHSAATLVEGRRKNCLLLPK